MGNVLLDITMSLDGFIAGPNDEAARLHDWFFQPSNGEASQNGAVIAELIQTIGAIVMGRRMYDLGEKEGGFVDNPFRVAHFVLTHRVPEKVARGETPFTFVTDGIESVLKKAHAAAGGRDVCVAGGANIAQQCIRARLIDEIQIHLVPVLLGKGIRLFGDSGTDRIELERTRVIETPDVTHLRFRVINKMRRESR